jgi:hypothetical protein
VPPDLLRALQILQDAQRRGKEEKSAALAKLSCDVAVLLESHDEWDEAVTAWMHAIMFARDAHDSEIERFAQKRVLEANTKVQQR